MLTEAEWTALGLSVRVALLALAIILPPTLALGYALARYRFPGRDVIAALSLMPLVMPPVVTGYLLLLALGPTSPIGSWLDAAGLPLAFRWTGAAVAAAVMALPLILRPIRLSFEAVDRRLVDASRTLGASRLRAFLTVTLPLATPGILAGAVLGFAKAFGEFGATITFAANIPGETRTLALAIHTALQTPQGESTAWRLTLVALVVSLLTVLAAEWITLRLSRLARGE